MIPQGVSDEKTKSFCGGRRCASWNSVKSYRTLDSHDYTFDVTSNIDTIDIEVEEAMELNLVNATLPVEPGLHMDCGDARSLGESLRERYINAAPYPHIVIDDFLPYELAEDIVKRFPEKAPGEKHFEAGYLGLHKRQILPAGCEENLSRYFDFLNSGPVLQFLEGLAGIEALISDPYFEGGGLHEISAGGKLGIHVDFRINERLHLHRRLNLLIYLNRDWQDSYGGHLEIWDRDMSKACHRVAPIFNRAVIFSTDGSSYHGHADPLATPDGVTRKSVALYYYTASKRIYEEEAALSTIYRARPDDDKSIHREAFRLRLMNNLRDWLPPVLFRALANARRRLRDGK